MFLVFWILVQIVMESLPVSSSGHVALVRKMFGDSWVVSENCTWIIDFLLHGPTIIILMCFFFAQWWHMVFVQPIAYKTFFSKNGLSSLVRALIFLGIVDGLTFLFWVVKDYVQLPLYVGFMITGLTLFSLSYTSYRYKNFSWNISDAVVLGIIQAVSLIPGVSRFATTYTASRFLQYSPQDSLAISFGVQLPLLIAAFAKGCMAMRSCPDLLQELFDLKILFVMLCAMMISYVLLYWVSKLAQKHELWKFSWYMIVPMIISFVL